MAIESGIIDFDTIQAQVNEMKKNEILRKHPYSIWCDKNGVWNTWIADEKRGRVKRRRNTKKELEDFLVKLYEEQSEEIQQEKKNASETINTIYPKWLEYKDKHNVENSYTARINYEWKRYYTIEKELINMPIRQLTKMYLDEWVHDLIRQYEMNKKQYYRMSIIIRECLDYAVELGIVDHNVFREVKINTKLFVKQRKKQGKEEVYSTDEQPKIIEDMMRRWEKNKKNTSPLAIIFNFELGLRIGELAALKFSDIEGNYITIQRQEIRTYEEIDGQYRFKCFKIVERVKTEDSYRKVYLSDTARYIIGICKEINENLHAKKSEYIFSKNDGSNVNHYSLQAMLVRGCKAIGIDTKTSHKIRKTYISTLIDAGVNIDTVRRLAGHADEQTTYNCYCFDRKTDEEKEKLLESCLNKSILAKSPKVPIENCMNIR